nr:ion channel [Burkholderiaceae bacterium]
MGDVLFLVLRRLRAPLIALLVVYAVSIAGLVSIPGLDADGRPWRMSFFHAFYVMSYTATTIGFGEIPYPFTDAQRLWVTATIYLSVIGWAYALGSVFALSRDPTFRAATARSLFERR